MRSLDDRRGGAIGIFVAARSVASNLPWFGSFAVN
jgi:hypothetical protein